MGKKYNKLEDEARKAVLNHKEFEFLDEKCMQICDEVMSLKEINHILDYYSNEIRDTVNTFAKFNSVMETIRYFYGYGEYK